MFKKVQKGVYYSEEKIPLVNKKSIDFLVEKALKENINLIRLCLHESKKSKLMTMLIVVLNHYLYPPHRHIWKDESYTIIFGKCIYIEYDAKGKIISNVIMNQGDSLLNKNGNFHSFKPLTPRFVFVENTTGPFLNQPLDFLKEFETC